MPNEARVREASGRFAESIAESDAKRFKVEATGSEAPNTRKIVRVVGFPFSCEFGCQFR